MADGWRTEDIPDQTGRHAVVTGGTGGIGFECVLALAAKGANVVVAGRDARKGEEAVQRVREANREASVRFERLDLADLSSVRSFGKRLGEAGAPLDILVNNAGVSQADRRETVDGFEMQFGTNHLGHFALTALLLPLLRTNESSRVVSVTSGAGRRARMDFDDLNGRKSFKPIAAYGQSKLANMLFIQELQRRSVAAGWGIEAFLAHPGTAATALMTTATKDAGLLRRVAARLFTAIGQPPADAAKPILFAATAPGAVAARMYGPDGFLETRGEVHESALPEAALDRAAAARLWAASEQMTGVVWPAA